MPAYRTRARLVVGFISAQQLTRRPGRAWSKSPALARLVDPGRGPRPVLPYIPRVVSLRLVPGRGVFIAPGRSYSSCSYSAWCSYSSCSYFGLVQLFGPAWSRPGSSWRSWPGRRSSHRLAVFVCGHKHPAAGHGRRHQLAPEPGTRATGRAPGAAGRWAPTRRHGPRALGRGP